MSSSTLVPVIKCIGWIYASISRVLNRGQIYPLGVYFTYPGGKFNDAEAAILCFFLQR